LKMLTSTTVVVCCVITLLFSLVLLADIFINCGEIKVPK